MVQPVATPLPVKTSFQAEAMFDFGKSLIKPQGRAALAAFAVQLGTIDYDVVITVGHTDSVGSPALNQKLSERRADAVRVYLIGQGIDASRIKSEGRGEKEPIASNDSASGRAQTRRVEIEVTGHAKQ